MSYIPNASQFIAARGDLNHRFLAADRTYPSCPLHYTSLDVVSTSPEVIV